MEKRNAKVENARLLASLLGLPSEEAVQLLKAKIVVTASNTPEAQVVKEHFISVLAKTLEFSEENCERLLEVVIGDISPTTHGERLWIRIGKNESLIYMQNPPTTVNAGNENLEVHGVFLRLLAQYACGFALRMIIRRGLPKGPNVLKLTYRKILGFDPALLKQTVGVGDVYLAGVGAVGSWAVDALTDFEIEGNGHLCDDDTFSGGNLQRYGIFGEEDIGQNKAARAVEKMQAKFPRFKLHPYPKRFGDLVKEKRWDGAWLKKLLVAVDSRLARRVLQEELPKEVYDASTTGVREIVLHFNKAPLKQACLCCVYKEDKSEYAHQMHIAETLGIPLQSVLRERLSEDDAKLIASKYPSLNLQDLVGLPCATLFKQLCGQGKLISEAEKQELTPFGFVSALAGTYLALEFIKRNLGVVDADRFNDIRINPWWGPEVERRNFLSIDPECSFHNSPIKWSMIGKVWDEAREVDSKTDSGIESVT